MARMTGEGQQGWETDQVGACSAAQEGRGTVRTLVL